MTTDLFGLVDRSGITLAVTSSIRADGRTTAIGRGCYHFMAIAITRRMVGTVDGAGTMTTGRAGNTAGRARIQSLTPWCLLVLALVILHLALMTNEHHGGMGTSHDTGLPAIPAALADLTATSGHDHGQDDAPSSTLDGCPVGQAILPLLLLLLGIVVLRFAHPAARIESAMAAPRRARSSSPPPLAATDRRALLQVFII